MRAAGLATVIVAALLAAGALAASAPEPAARAGAIRVAGTFAQTNSRAGMPIFAASGLGPGDSAAGTVTIANTGTLGGWFGLSQSEVAGALAGRLALDVRALGAGSIYSGRFDALPPTTLGWFAPGATRTYSFTATLPHGSGDNAFMATDASARFVWTAIEGPPTPTPTPDGGGAPGATVADRSPPRLRIAIPRTQRVLDRWYVRVQARCDERCRLTATGRLRFSPARRVRMPATRGRGAAGRWVTLRLRVPPAARRSLRRTLRGGRRATIELRITTRDDAGNARVALRTVRLRPLRR